jgi:hypothetical protein
MIKGDNMRVRINYNNRNRENATIVIEVVQMNHYDEGTIGLVLPYSEYFASKGYNVYESTEQADEHDFSYWSDTLLRTGYLDLTRTNLKFNRYKAKPVNT